MGKRQNATIVFRDADGRALTIDELQGVSGELRWEVIWGGDVPAEAKRLHEQAREVGGRGQYEAAIALLTKASALAPDWPYPIYDRAYTHLLMKHVDAARADYQKTVDLAPRGFFTAITALDTLIREQKGDLPSGIYLAYVSLESMTDRTSKAEIVRQLVEKVPRFAPAWKALAVLADQDSERLSAVENGLAAAPDAETKGILIINKASVLERMGNREAGVRLLGELALDPRSTLATEHLAKATLARMIRK
jgi:tetratricopeptide (TPR) repeat protein